MEKTLIALVSLTLLFPLGNAFSAVLPVQRKLRSGIVLEASSKNDNNRDELGRRNVFLLPLQVALVGKAILPANAAMENTQSIFKAGASISDEVAEQRLQEGRKSAQYLLDHYDEICEGGGDNVR
eukprot:378808-Ditylum_brightwellii.AAC.1